jgi:hypothetical protein
MPFKGLNFVSLFSAASIALPPPMTRLLFDEDILGASRTFLGYMLPPHVQRYDIGSYKNAQYFRELEQYPQKSNKYFAFLGYISDLEVTMPFYSIYSVHRRRRGIGDTYLYCTPIPLLRRLDAIRRHNNFFDVGQSIESRRHCDSQWMLSGSQKYRALL